MIFDTSLRVIFKFQLWTMTLLLACEWNEWKLQHPICHSQRWKRAAATWRFKLVRTVSTFLPHSPPSLFCFVFTANELIKWAHRKREDAHKPQLSSPPLPSQMSLVILPALDVWDTDVAFLQCWPWSIVVSRARGKCISPLGLGN